MPRYSILFIFFIFLSLSLYSQEQRDVIYLNNGSIIKGNITERTDELVKIESCCGSIFVFQMNNILRIEKETFTNSGRLVKQKGYLSFTSMGFLLGSPENERVAPFSLLSEHVYRINKYVAVGGVIGYEMLQEAVMPLGANVKTYFLDRDKNVFIGLTGGYSISLENPDQNIFKNSLGGPFFTCEIGVTIPVSDYASFFMALGYRYNKLKYERTDWWLGEVDREVKYNRISFRFGLALY